MKSIALFALIAVLATAASTPLLARDRKNDAQRDRQQVTDKRTKDAFDHGLQEVRHSASPNTPGNGWRYFTDPAARRAVVISPQGDYYYSRGRGLQWVAAEQI